MSRVWGKDRGKDTSRGRREDRRKVTVRDRERIPVGVGGWIGGNIRVGVRGKIGGRI